jgi:plastocyanin
MRIIRTWMLAGAVAAAVGCSGDSGTPTDTGNGGTGGTGGTGGGAVGTVAVGNFFFQSGHNGTRNPAQDTVAVGQTVTWTWTNTGGEPHSVEALPVDHPSFTSSQVMSGNGQTYSFTFTAPGTYHYQCAVHGALMTGIVVVQ